MTQYIYSIVYIIHPILLIIIDGNLIIPPCSSSAPPPCPQSLHPRPISPFLSFTLLMCVSPPSISLFFSHSIYLSALSLSLVSPSPLSSPLFSYNCVSLSLSLSHFLSLPLLSSPLSMCVSLSLSLTLSHSQSLSPLSLFSGLSFLPPVPPLCFPVPPPRATGSQRCV